jgi:tRNA-binding protein
MEITIEEFDKIEMRAGSIVHVEMNKRARKPAYRIDIDFGSDIGVKSTSAQITELYNEENLIGKQVICCVNLPAIRIGSVKSEVRILGTDSAQGCVLLQPSQKVENGDMVF